MYIFPQLWRGNGYSEVCFLWAASPRNYWYMTCWPEDLLFARKCCVNYCVVTVWSVYIFSRWHGSVWPFLVSVVDGLEDGDWYRWGDSPVTAGGSDTRDFWKILFRCPQIAYQPKMLFLTWRNSYLKKILSLQRNEGKVQWGQQILTARNICKIWFNLKLRSVCWKQIIPAAEWGHPCCSTINCKVYLVGLNHLRIPTQCVRIETRV